MAKTTGPQAPGGLQAGKLLDLRAKIEAKRLEKAAEEEPAGETPAAPVSQADEFAKGKGTGKVVLPEAGEGERGGGVKARLAALGLKGGDALIKTAGKDKARITDTPLGKVLEGAVMAESAAGLQKLNGVVKAHEIGLQESLVKSADLLVLKSLIEVDRFTIEGSPSLGTLDALAALERGRSIYIGFNATLGKIVLPRLREIDVLIIEGNPKLREIVLPALEVVHRYFHIHDNTALDSVTLGKRDKPVKCGELELVGNAHTSYPGIHVVTG